MLQDILIIRIAPALCIALLLFFTPIAKAASILHLDVEVWGEEDALFAGYCQTPGVSGCDLDGLMTELGLPEDGLPIEGASGKLVLSLIFKIYPAVTLKPRIRVFVPLKVPYCPVNCLAIAAWVIYVTGIQRNRPGCRHRKMCRSHCMADLMPLME